RRGYQRHHHLVLGVFELDRVAAAPGGVLRGCRKRGGHQNKNREHERSAHIVTPTPAARSCTACCRPTPPRIGGRQSHRSLATPPMYCRPASSTAGALMYCWPPSEYPRYSQPVSGL